MSRKPDISLKKQAKQRRSIATVQAIVQAATYILKRHGLRGFTANKVAEKAGVNVASFYQYFPNKEALLFYIARLTWEEQFEKLSPILVEPGVDNAARLKRFVREFFTIEAAEANLRQALRMASVDLKETEEFRALIAKGKALTGDFIKQAVHGRDTTDLDFELDFIVLMITSVAERTTDDGTTGSDLIRQADLLSDILVAHLGIGGTASADCTDTARMPERDAELTGKGPDSVQLP